MQVKQGTNSFRELTHCHQSHLEYLRLLVLEAQNAAIALTEILLAAGNLHRLKHFIFFAWPSYKSY